MYLKENWVIRIEIIFICVVTLLLIACTPQETSVTPFQQSSPTSTQIQKTHTPTPIQTPRPTFTLTATPTVNTVTELASEFDVPAVCLFAYQVSKDKNWIGADCNISHELIITQKDAKNKTTIPYQDILDKDPNAFRIKPLSWSSDSRYFYFTTTVCCSNYSQREDDGALYQYDTKNTIWDILVNASYKPYYFFSDDGKRFAYIKQYNNPYDEIEVGMVEILTKKNKRIVLKGYLTEGKEYEWSKNMDKFAIVIWELQFRNGTPGNVLLIFDFKKMDMEIVEKYNWNNLLTEE